MSNFLPKWMVVTASLLWLALILARELTNVDPTQLGLRSPDVEAGMQACTSEDMHQRYDCKERVILSNQRSTFVKATGLGFLLFGPPVALWLLSNRLGRMSLRSYRPDRRPPSIAKWRVR
jgi:hypothetical protein